MDPLNPILAALNDRAPDYAFGELQAIRKRRRPLKKRPSRHAFGSTDAQWAHHIGGRTELQFNVAEDEDELRWGVAISLQASNSLRDPTVLWPNLRRLSSALETHGAHLRRLGFAMWDWTPRGRSRNRPPGQVSEDLYSPESFIFVGKHAPYDSFDPDRVLRDFDLLLPIYEFVEFEPDESPPALYPQREFVFEPDPPGERAVRPRTATATRTAGVSQVSLDHRALQDTLKLELEREGASVGTENRDGRGGYIDLVACRAGEYEFYEIKTSATARLAIRDALGQLLEYAYWPAPVRPARLVVVAPHPLGAEAADYLATLMRDFRLPVGYRQVSPAR